MGKKDSSKTRVEPVFSKLYEQDSSGQSWLPQLLRLPEGENKLQILPEDSFLIQEHAWGSNEIKLEPPLALLSWLIRNPRKPQSGNLSNDSEITEKRKNWINGSKDCILQGLTSLRNNSNKKKWYIFEGKTQPDVFIETESLIVIIEGKRTEHGPTTDTKWMVGRHQMLRHIDCAFEISAGKRVIGFFIVEGEDDSTSIPSEWLQFSKDTLNPNALATSLPHRGLHELEQIKSSFIGVTTWQRICHEFKDFGLSWENLPDLVKN